MDTQITITIVLVTWETQNCLSLYFVIAIDEFLIFFIIIILLLSFFLSKDAICDSLQSYNTHIDHLKKEMDTATTSAKNIRSDIQEIRNK